MNKTKIIFNMRIAAELVRRNHKVANVLPNPRFPQFDMWEFEWDESLDEDFKALQKEVANGK